MPCPWMRMRVVQAGHQDDSGGDNRSDKEGSSVIWNCASCGTTLTYTVSPFLAEPVGMLKCPRCDKWMDRVTENAAPGEAG